MLPIETPPRHDHPAWAGLRVSCDMSGAALDHAIRNRLKTRSPQVFFGKDARPCLHMEDVFSACGWGLGGADASADIRLTFKGGDGFGNFCDTGSSPTILPGFLRKRERESEEVHDSSNPVGFSQSQGLILAPITPTLDWIVRMLRKPSPSHPQDLQDPALWLSAMLMHELGHAFFAAGASQGRWAGLPEIQQLRWLIWREEPRLRKIIDEIVADLVMIHGVAERLNRVGAAFRLVLWRARERHPVYRIGSWVDRADLAPFLKGPLTFSRVVACALEGVARHVGAWASQDFRTMRRLGQAMDKHHVSKSYQSVVGLADVC